MERAIERAGHNKAAGEDSTPYEFFQLCFTKDDSDPNSATRLRTLASFFNIMFRFGVWPAQFCRGIISPLFTRKGDRLRPSSFRPITLLRALGKLYEYVLLGRLSPFCESRGLISEEQAGFRPSRSVLDQILILDFIISSQKKSSRVWLSFLDINQAYDRTCRAKLFTRLLDAGISGRMFRSLHSMFDTVKRAVKIGTNISDFFDCECGVPQGSILSPLLFDLYIDPLVKRLHQRGLGIIVGGRRIPALLFADDIVLLASSAKELQLMLNVCSEFARDFRLSFSKSKSNVVVCPAPRFRPTLTLQDFSLAYADSYLSLGCEMGQFSPVAKTSRWARLVTRVATESRRRVHEVLAVTGLDDGLAPYLSRLYYLSHVAGRLDFASQIWSVQLTAAQRSSLQQVQYQFVRGALHLPSGAPPSFSLGELNLLPLHLHHHELALRFYGKVCNMPPERLPRHLLNLYLANTRRYNHSWFHHLLQLIRSEYPELAFACTGNCTPPISEGSRATPDWETVVHKAVRDKWTSAWRSEIASLPSLRYYARVRSVPGVTEYLKDFSHLGVSHKLRLLSGTPDLCARLSRMRLSSSDCPFCPGFAETREHFLLRCPHLESARRAWLTFARARCADGFDQALSTWLRDLGVTASRSPLLFGEVPDACGAICSLFDPKASDAVRQALLSDSPGSTDPKILTSSFLRIIERSCRLLFKKLFDTRTRLLRALHPSDSHSLLSSDSPTSAINKGSNV